MGPYQNVVSYSQNFIFPGYLSGIIFVPGFSGLIEVVCNNKYSLVMSSMFILLLSVPRYFGDSDASSVCFTFASRPNIRKNGAIPDDSVGQKLYAAVAFQTRSSHSTLFSSCFAMQAFKNLWNPSIHPLHWGE